MANQNKSFLLEEERDVLTPKSIAFPRDSRERFFEVEGNVVAMLKFIPTDAMKVEGK
ncbi:hypothetical protein J6X90_01415 [Candidatus Saccharibacteria bacterium]|nr:hypothetical protein [Candidatus Saccharibacteria bacterium]